MPRVNHGSSASHAAVVRDHRGDAGIGRAQHRAPGLERAHGGDLVVLARGDRAAVPRVVGHVDEDRGVARGDGELAAEHVLVADVEREALAGGDERRLQRGARRLVRERDGEHAVDEPADEPLQAGSTRRRARGDACDRAAADRPRGSPRCCGCARPRRARSGAAPRRVPPAPRHRARAPRPRAPRRPRRGFRRRTADTRSRAAPRCVPWPAARARRGSRSSADGRRDRTSPPARCCSARARR